MRNENLGNRSLLTSVRRISVHTYIPYNGIYLDTEYSLQQSKRPSELQQVNKRENNPGPQDVIDN